MNIFIYTDWKLSPHINLYTILFRQVRNLILTKRCFWVRSPLLKKQYIYAMGFKTCYPKMWHFDILNTKEFEKNCTSRKVSLKSLSYSSPLKQVISFPKNVPSIHKEDKKHSYNHKWRIWDQEICTNFVKQILSS